MLTHFEVARQNRPKLMPMHKVVAFALFSTRPEAITRITLDGLDLATGGVLITDMKRPTKIGDYHANIMRSVGQDSHQLYSSAQFLL